jgi:bacterioferritin (cytochrome b1)
MNNNFNNMNNIKMDNNINNMNLRSDMNNGNSNVSKNSNIDGIINMQNNNMVNVKDNLEDLSQNKLKTEVENSTKVNEKIVFLTFTFEKYQKNIFIDVNGNDKFEEVIKKLEEKYSWLTTIKNKIYIYGNAEIKNYNMTLNELGIVDNSDIKVII